MTGRRLDPPKQVKFGLYGRKEDLAGGGHLSQICLPRWPLDLIYANERGEETKVGVAELEIAASVVAA